MRKKFEMNFLSKLIRRNQLTVAFLILVSFSARSEIDWSKGKGDEDVGNAYPNAKIKNLKVPLVTSKKLSLIKGSCVYVKIGDDFEYPLKFVPIKIFKDSKLISETNTDGNGVFVFNLNIPRGKYILRVDSEKYVGEKDLAIDESKQINIVLKVIRR